MTFIDIEGKGKPKVLDVLKELVDSIQVVGLQAMSGEYIDRTEEPIPQHIVDGKYIMYDIFTSIGGFRSTVDTSLTTADYNGSNYSYGGLSFTLNTNDTTITTAYPSGCSYLHSPDLHSQGIYFVKLASYNYSGNTLYLYFDRFSSDGTLLDTQGYEITLSYIIQNIETIRFFPMVGYDKVYVYFLTTYASRRFEEGLIALNPGDGSYTILNHRTWYRTHYFEGWGQIGKSFLTSNSDYANNLYSGPIFWYEVYQYSGGWVAYYYWYRYFDGRLVYNYQQDDTYELGHHPKFARTNLIIDNCTGNSVGAYYSAYDNRYAYYWAGGPQEYKGNPFRTMGISSDGSTFLSYYSNTNDPDNNSYDGGWSVYGTKDDYNNTFSALWSEYHPGMYHIVRQLVDLSGLSGYTEEYSVSIPPYFSIGDGVIIRITDNLFAYNGTLYSTVTYSSVGTVNNFPSYSSIIAYDVANAGVLVKIGSSIIARTNFCVTSEPKYVVTKPIDLTDKNKMVVYWVEQNVGTTYWKASIVDANDINNVLYDNVPKGEAIDVNFGQVRLKFEVVYDSDYNTGSLFGYSSLWWKE